MMKAKIGDFLRVNGKISGVVGVSTRKPVGASMEDWIGKKAVTGVKYFLENGESILDTDLCIEDVLGQGITV